MKKCSFGVLVFSGLVSLGLLLSSPSMLYALDSNNTDEGSASNVAIASVESAIDAQRDSTFAVEQNSQVDNETPSEVSNQIVWHQGWISPEEGAGFWRWGLSDGTIAVSSWRHINGSWYWFDDEGRMAQDGLVQVGGCDVCLLLFGRNACRLVPRFYGLHFCLALFLRFWRHGKRLAFRWQQLVLAG